MSNLFLILSTHTHPHVTQSGTRAFFQGRHFCVIGRFSGAICWMFSCYPHLNFLMPVVRCDTWSMRSFLSPLESVSAKWWPALIPVRESSKPAFVDVWHDRRIRQPCLRVEQHNGRLICDSDTFPSALRLSPKLPASNPRRRPRSIRACFRSSLGHEMPRTTAEDRLHCTNVFCTTVYACGGDTHVLFGIHMTISGHMS